MAERAIVIGGGVIGVGCAYYLSLDGWHVTIVDSQGLGQGCSYGTAGLIAPSHSEPLPGPGVIGQALRWMRQPDSPFFVRLQLHRDFLRWGWQFRRFCNQAAADHGRDALVALSRASTVLFDELARSGLDFFYQRKGVLHAFFSDQAFKGAEHEREVQERMGFRSRLLSRDELATFEPALGPSVRGGLFVEGDAHGHSFGYVRALASAVESRGGTLINGRRVVRIVMTDGRVRGAVLAAPDEELSADLVVLAAGAWTPSLAAPLGCRIPLQPAKGYSCTIDAYPGSPRIPIRLPELRVIITPFGQRLRFAGTLELSGYNREINERRYRAILKAAQKALKEGLVFHNEEAWCGLRPVTPDGLPVIGRPRGLDGLIIATGHAMLGFAQSPATGKLVAELARGSQPSVPLEPFRLNRF